MLLLFRRHFTLATTRTRVLSPSFTDRKLPNAQFFKWFGCKHGQRLTSLERRSVANSFPWQHCMYLGCFTAEGPSWQAVSLSLCAFLFKSWRCWRKYNEAQVCVCWTTAIAWCKTFYHRHWFMSAVWSNAMHVDSLTLPCFKVVHRVTEVKPGMRGPGSHAKYIYKEVLKIQNAKTNSAHVRAQTVWMVQGEHLRGWQPLGSVYGHTPCSCNNTQCPGCYFSALLHQKGSNLDFTISSAYLSKSGCRESIKVNQNDIKVLRRLDKTKGSPCCLVSAHDCFGKRSLKTSTRQTKLERKQKHCHGHNWPQQRGVESSR